jgi:hypothetical protein
VLEAGVAGNVGVGYRSHGCVVVGDAEGGRANGEGQPPVGGSPAIWCRAVKVPD